jgi:hypothetical protein
LDQESVVGTLADIVERSALMEAPALIVVGDVVSLADKLDWFVAPPESPLHRDSARTDEVTRA